MSLCKRRGFVFQGSEIYGGLKGTWDLGPLGTGLNAAILMNAKVWEASGHTGAGFCDPLVEDMETGERYRADHLLKDAGIPAEGLTLEEIDALIIEKGIKSPKGNPLSQARQFNMMFETTIGATAGPDGKVYLRPETAQGIFVNFKNVVDSMSPKMPFGIGQVGKAFRNEIAPREFLFRVREFEEIEYFVKPEEWEARFEEWRQAIWAWFDHLGLARENIREYEVPENDLAHYSKRTIDFEYNYPGKGFDELAGFAYRTDHDLKSHMEASGVSLEYIEHDGTRFIPHVLEPSFGVGRAMTALLCEAYTEDEMDGEVRTYLKLPTHLAPYRACVSPLLKNKPELVAKAREVFLMLKKEFGNIAYDDNGNIGKRYRRQDEIGTPYCIVIDFDTLGENPSLLDSVTVRQRDSGEQERVTVTELASFLR